MPARVHPLGSRRKPWLRRSSVLEISTENTTRRNSCSRSRPGLGDWVSMVSAPSEPPAAMRSRRSWSTVSEATKASARSSSRGRAISRGTPSPGEARKVSPSAVYRSAPWRRSSRVPRRKSDSSSMRAVTPSRPALWRSARVIRLRPHRSGAPSPIAPNTPTPGGL